MKNAEDMRKLAEEMAEMLEGLSDNQKEFIRGIILGVKLKAELESDKKLA